MEPTETAAGAGPAGGHAADRGDLRFRILRSGALDDHQVSRVLEAIVESFGTWPPFDPGVPALDHLRWKMASPAGDLAAIVGEVGDELACCQVCLTQQVRIGDALVSRVRSADFAVRPAFRGRRAASALAAFKREAVELPTLLLTETRAPAIQHLSRQRGSRPLGNPVLALLLPIDAGRMVARDVRRLRAARSWVESTVLVLASRVRRALRARAVRRRSTVDDATIPSKPVVRRIERFDARFASFWDEARRAFDVAVERTPAYLNWRYCDPRGGSWTVGACVDETTVLGYGAWRVEAGRGIIADLLALPGRLDVVGALADAAIAAAVADGAGSVLCWLPERHPYRRVLHDRGFLDRPTRVTHMARTDLMPAELAAVVLAPSARIHFTLGDSDFV